VTTAFETRINASVDPLDTQGAGDQGLMFGYAAVDTEDLMPLPIDMAHQLAKRLADIRKGGVLAYLRPDGKTQVTIEYDGNSAIRLDTVVVSSQHDDEVSQETLRQGIIAEVVRPVLAQSDWQNLDVSNPQVLVNPTGRFVTGGPMGDAGLTGRKIIVDTYGGMARHGGGAFSGKDPSKVDRSAAYAMRWVAKNVVASGLATRCEVQIAYAIGKAQPVGIFVETYGTSVVPEEQIGEAILQVFDLRPAAIVRDLQLLDTALVHYRPTSTYGHFGRKEISYQRLVPGIPWESERVTVEIPWERTDRKDALAASVRG
jgi:S-adenosylmethionine synthetase